MQRCFEHHLRLEEQSPATGRGCHRSILSKVFPIRRQNKEVKICSWNIAGLKDKLQDNMILQFVMSFDIVFLLEAKQNFNSTVPGFDVYTNVSRVGQHRGGGVVMLVRCILTDDIINVDTDSEKHIWITMSWWPNQKIGEVYVYSPK